MAKNTKHEAQAADYIKVSELPADRLYARPADALYEAAVALSRGQDKREFFIRNPEKLGQSIPELEERFRSWLDFEKEVLGLRDELMKAETDIRPYLELTVIYDGETPFLPALIQHIPLSSAVRLHTADVEADAEALKGELIRAWHAMLLGMAEGREEDESSPTLAEQFAVRDRLMAETDFTDVASQLRLVMNSENDSESKVRLLELCSREDEIFTRTAALLLRLSPPIAHAASRLEEALGYAEDLSSLKAWDVLSARIGQTVGFEVATGTRVYIFPQLLMPNSLSLHYTHADQVVIGLGIYFLDLIEETDAAEARIQTIAEQCKVLSDPSRLKILHLLQARPMYLRELADALELSPATMSHHLQNLLNNDFVRLDASHNSRRVYYSLRPASFARLGELITAIGVTK